MLYQIAADMGSRPRDVLNLPIEEREFLFAARSERNRRENEAVKRARKGR